MLDSRPYLKETQFPRIHRSELTCLQVNLGYLCNLSCTHCHVNAGPKRTELMAKDNIDTVLMFLEQQQIKLLDLTGGAPEMNPHFRYLVSEARRLGVTVIDRCNLSIFFEPGYEDLPEFLAENQVQITASLPCYLEDNVAQQRGKGVYQQSVKALQTLNKLGYARDKNLVLNLVYNPNGYFLPPNQSALQADYKRELAARFDIEFNDLFALANMPIARFGSMLMSKGELDNYLDLLKNNYSAENLNGVMCRSLISVDWQGYVYDCDFNQMLDWPISVERKPSLIASDQEKTKLSDIVKNNLVGRPIVVGEHCYACTAGQGSSCGGAL